MAIFPWMLPFQIFSISFKLLFGEGNKQIYLWELKGRKQGEGLRVFGQMLGFHESVFTDDTVKRQNSQLQNQENHFTQASASQASVTTKTLVVVDDVSQSWAVWQEKRQTERPLGENGRQHRGAGLWKVGGRDSFCDHIREGLVPECRAFKSCTPFAKPSAVHYLTWPLLGGCNRYH